MKRLSFAIMLALCTMGVWAQEGIKVEFEGASETHWSVTFRTRTKTTT